MPLDRLTWSGASIDAQISAANTPTDWVVITGSFVARVAGAFTGTVIIEQSDDGGTTIMPVTDGAGTTKEFTGPERVIVDEIASQGASYRFRATTLTAGTALCRFEK